MRRLGIPLLILALGLSAAPPAKAYTVRSGFSEGCHEIIMAKAFRDFVLDLPLTTFTPPPSETWREVSHFAFDFADVNPEGYDDAHRFLLVSLIIGVRAPDTEGHSLLQMEHLRNLHADPSDEGQYAHSLRGLTDDNAEGDAQAVAGTRDTVRELMRLALDYLRRPEDEQVIKGHVFLDFYGQIEVEVWAPFYYLGRAAHAAQDSFSHTLRSAEHDYRRIVHVFNYLEAIAGNLSEARDGLPHSDSMDDCNREDTRPVTEAAEEATVDLCYAFRAQLTGADPDALDSFFEKWMQLEPGCTLENDFCGNTVQLNAAREAQTKPYVESIFGCHTAGRAPLSVLILLVFGGWAWRRQRRRP